MATNIKFHFEQDGYIQFPTKPRDVLSLLHRYVQVEESLPALAQITAPPLSRMQDLYNQLDTAVSRSRREEDRRSAEKGKYNELVQALREKGARAIQYLRFKHHDNIMELESWGLDVKASQRGGYTFRKPNNDNEWIVFLDDYLRQEVEMPADERVPLPTLEEMQRLQRGLKESGSAWRTAYGKRQVATERKHLLAKQAILMLRWALISIVMGQLDGQLSQELEQWGFRYII